VGAVEKTASHQEGNHYQSNRNQYLPAAARRLLCRHSLARRKPRDSCAKTGAFEIAWKIRIRYARWFGRSFGRCLAFGSLHLTDAAFASQRVSLTPSVVSWRERSNPKPCLTTG